MAEIATIARPYAEALLKSVADTQLSALAQQVQALGSVAADVQMRQFADNPKVNDDQVYDLLTSVVKDPLSDAARNLLRTVIANGRLSALPQIAQQFSALVNARSGVSDALVESAFEITPAQLAEVLAALEKRFARKLNPTVVVAPELIGGIRVTVGDEVLDTSVSARLEHMKAALIA